MPKKQKKSKRPVPENAIPKPVMLLPAAPAKDGSKIKETSSSGSGSGLSASSISPTSPTNPEEAAALAYAASFVRKKITSNWEKYEKPIEPEGEDPIAAEDRNFSYLIKNSNTDGAHFQLPFEKKWEENFTQPIESLFSVDLKLLAIGLTSIPFHERIGLDQSRLSNSTLFDFKMAANAKFEDAEELNKDHIFDDSPNEKTLLKFMTNPASSTNNKEDSDESDKLDNGVIQKPLSEMQEKGNDRSEKEELTSDDDEEDLEDWLDGMLDKK